jgi:hypothetical protein
VGREDVDCDGHLDIVDEDPNDNGQCDPGEPCDVDGDGILEHEPLTDLNGNGVWDQGEPRGEDRNGNNALDDRPFPRPGELSQIYPYGSTRPTVGGLLVVSVAWNGTSYDFDAINTPTRLVNDYETGKVYRVIDASRTADIGPRVSGARLMALDQSAGLATWRFAMTSSAIPRNDEVGGTRTIFTQREFRDDRTGTVLALESSQPDGSAKAYISLVSSTAAGNDPLPSLSAPPVSPGSVALMHADAALPGAMESLHPFDLDGDGHWLPLDDCPAISNSQSDLDRDGLGDSCDMAPPADGQWASVTTSTTPGERIRAAAVYDPLGARTVLYGGSGDTQTWAFDGAAWTPLATVGTPGARAGHGMVYDSLRHRILLFGGQRLADQTELNDLWAFDGVQWLNITPVSSPTARQDLGLAFDSARGLLVLFGGTHDGKALADTWVYDGVDWRFVPSSSGPSARARFQMAYDAGRTTTLLNGGVGPLPNSPYNDTWQFDGTRWLLVDHLGDLPPTWDGKMVYDPASRQLIMFGGNDATLYAAYAHPFSSATRTFDGTTWKTLSTQNVPRASCDPPVVAFDSGRGVLVDYDGCTSKHYELRRPLDLDGDGVPNGGDNCPLVANPAQADADHDGVGDECDNCVAIPNGSQQNLDGDLYGDVCDFCVLVADDAHVDSDGDGLGDECDCRPQDPVSGLPPEVGALVAVQHANPGAATAIVWNADVGTGQYESYVGTIPSHMMGGRPNPYDYHCLQGNLAPTGGSVTAFDASEPAVGTARYYLMSGENACGEGTLGASSAGQPRPAPYSCGLPHPTPPVIDDVQFTIGTSTAVCPEYDGIIRAWLCEAGFTPDMYTLSPGPAIQVQSAYTGVTIRVHASSPGTGGVAAGGLSLLARYRRLGDDLSLAIPDDGSQTVTLVPQEGTNAENCFVDPGAGVCSCSGARQFPTSSQDPIAGDEIFTRGVVLHPSSQTASYYGAGAVTDNCLYRRTQSVQVVPQEPPGTPTPFTIEAWDAAGYVTTWPAPVPIAGQAPTFDCLGDACACCVYLSSDPVSECRGLAGLLGAPGTGFESGLCKSF